MSISSGTNTLLLAAVSGFLAVAVGAFGAHGLENLVSAERLATWETGVQYHFFHTLALLAVGYLQRERVSRCLGFCSGFFVAGILLFSGSLYLLVLLDVPLLGAITPLGGVAFLAGWALLGWDQYRSGKSRD